MPSDLKNAIKKQLKADIPLAEIKENMEKRGYPAGEVNRAVREVISGSRLSTVYWPYMVIMGTVGFFLVILVVTYAVSDNSSYNTVYALKVVEPNVDRVRLEITLRVENKTDAFLKPIVNTQFTVTTNLKNADGYMVYANDKTAQELDRLISKGERKMMYIGDTVSGESYNLGWNVYRPVKVEKGEDTTYLMFETDPVGGLLYFVITGDYTQTISFEVVQKNNYLLNSDIYVVAKSS